MRMRDCDHIGPLSLNSQGFLMGDLNGRAGMPAASQVRGGQV